MWAKVVMGETRYIHLRGRVVSGKLDHMTGAQVLLSNIQVSVSNYIIFSYYFHFYVLSLSTLLSSP